MTDKLKDFPKWPKESINEYIYSTKNGLQSVLGDFDKSDSDKNLVWSTDYTKELPVVIKKSGSGSM